MQRQSFLFIKKVIVVAFINETLFVAGQRTPSKNGDICSGSENQPKCQINFNNLRVPVPLPFDCPHMGWSTQCLQVQQHTLGRVNVDGEDRNITGEMPTSQCSRAVVSGRRFRFEFDKITNVYAVAFKIYNNKEIADDFGVEVALRRSSDQRESTSCGYRSAFDRWIVYFCFTQENVQQLRDDSQELGFFGDSVSINAPESVQFCSVLILPYPIQPCAAPGYDEKSSDFSPKRNVYFAGESVAYFCKNSDLVLFGSRRRQCQANGQWTGSAASCAAVSPLIPLSYSWNWQNRQPYNLKSLRINKQQAVYFYLDRPVLIFWIKFWLKQDGNAIPNVKVADRNLDGRLETNHCDGEGYCLVEYSPYSSAQDLSIAMSFSVQSQYQFTIEIEKVKVYGLETAFPLLPTTFSCGGNERLQYDASIALSNNYIKQKCDFYLGRPVQILSIQFWFKQTSPGAYKLPDVLLDGSTFQFQTEIKQWDNQGYFLMENSLNPSLQNTPFTSDFYISFPPSLSGNIKNVQVYGFLYGQGFQTAKYSSDHTNATSLFYRLEKAVQIALVSVRISWDDYVKRTYDDWDVRVGSFRLVFKKWKCDASAPCFLWYSIPSSNPFFGTTFVRLNSRIQISYIPTILIYGSEIENEAPNNPIDRNSTLRDRPAFTERDSTTCLSGFATRSYVSDDMFCTGSTSSIECYRAFCPPPTAVVNGSWKYTDDLFSATNYTVEYECAEGFQLEGPKTLICHNGRWNFSPPECRRIYCPQPESRANGSYGKGIGSMDFPVGRIVEWHCNEGFVISENIAAINLTCMVNRTWLPDDFQCIGNRAQDNSSTLVISLISLCVILFLLLLCGYYGLKSHFNSRIRKQSNVIASEPIYMNQLDDNHREIVYENLRPVNNSMNKEHFYENELIDDSVERKSKPPTKSAHSNANQTGSTPLNQSIEPIYSNEVIAHSRTNEAQEEEIVYSQIAFDSNQLQKENVKRKPRKQEATSTQPEESEVIYTPVEFPNPQLAGRQWIGESQPENVAEHPVYAIVQKKKPPIK